MRVLSLAETTLVSGGMEEVTVTGKRINSTCNILIRQEFKEISGAGDIGGSGIAKVVVKGGAEASATSKTKTTEFNINDTQACKGVSVETTKEGLRVQIP